MQQHTQGSASLGARRPPPEQTLRQQVARHELACRDDPAAFVQATAAWALGAWLALALPALLAVLALAAALAGWWMDEAVWPPLVALLGLLLGWTLASAVWPQALPAGGKTLPRNQAPRLFSLVDRLRGAPPPAPSRPAGAPPQPLLPRAIAAWRQHRNPPLAVQLDSSLQAELQEAPRLGLLGWPQRRLRLGLPLLMALDGPQLAGVLAREFAHQGRGVEPRLAWIFRLHQRWASLSPAQRPARLSAPGADLARRLFYRHLYPGFEARALVLAQLHQRAADACAVQVAGAAAALQAPLALAVQQRYLDQDFWPRLWEQAARVPEPDAAPLRGLRVLLRDSPRQPAARRWLAEALKLLHTQRALEPSLRERVAWLQGQAGDEADAPAAQPAPVEVPVVPARSAAEVLLGSGLEPWIDMLDADWRHQVSDEWREQHADHRRRERLLNELADADANEPLPLADLLLWARLARRVQGPGAALAPLRLTMARHHAIGEARYLLACALLDHGPAVQPRGRRPDPTPSQAEAIELLQSLANEGRESLQYTQALAADPHWRLPAAQRLEVVLEQREDFEALKPVRARLRELALEAERAEKVLRSFQGEQQLEAAPTGLRSRHTGTLPSTAAQLHTRLSARVLADTLALLKSEPAVGKAWLLRKTSPQVRGWSLYLMVIERSHALFQPDPAQWSALLEARIQLPLPVAVVDLGQPYWQDIGRTDLVQAMRSTEGACIYTAEAPK
ncbi:MAG TPA: hypothetical protein VLA61_02085 [Ideonella sp.]|uniref:hypothetical protein n=1 Tax=Ideonella sp. TaxID=1929293 RepID=UPI002C6DFD8D|nr:hypothetical protein [Ideonella sp.]HSI47040.1 hypothetical protein [Ideonella sp.]